MGDEELRVRGLEHDNNSVVVLFQLPHELIKFTHETERHEIGWIEVEGDPPNAPIPTDLEVVEVAHRSCSLATPAAARSTHRRSFSLRRPASQPPSTTNSEPVQ